MNKRDKAIELRQKCLDMIALCKKECREFTDDEQAEFDDTKNELIALSEEIQAVDDKVNAVAETVPEVPVEDAPKEDAPVEEQKADEEEQPAEEQTAETQNEEVDAPKEDAPEDNSNNSDEEEKSADEEQINNTEDNAPVDDAQKEDAPKTEEQEDTKNKRSIDKVMKDFSLLKMIRSTISGAEHTAENKAVLEAGANEFRSSNLAFNGQIQIPAEKRTVTVATEHDDVIETDFQSILDPLYAKSVLAQSGATYLTNLVGDVLIPVLGKGTCGWSGEIDNATESTNTFSNIKMTPHRLTCYTEISRQMLAQDSIGVEAAIRRDILNAINDKLEATILGDGDGSINSVAGDGSINSVAGVAPVGILNGKSATTVSTYATLTDFESGLEQSNIYGAPRYILSPKAKASLRSLSYGGKSTALVLENGEVDGTPALSTTNVENKKFIFGDFTNVYVGQWGGIDLTVDNISTAARGTVKIVINCYFDAVVTRPEAILLGEFA